MLTTANQQPRCATPACLVYALRAQHVPLPLRIVRRRLSKASNYKHPRTGRHSRGRVKMEPLFQAQRPQSM